MIQSTSAYGVMLMRETILVIGTSLHRVILLEMIAPPRASEYVIWTMIQLRPVYGAMIVKESILVIGTSLYRVILMEMIASPSAPEYGAILEEVPPLVQPPKLSCKKEHGAPSYYSPLSTDTRALSWSL